MKQFKVFISGNKWIDGMMWLNTCMAIYATNLNVDKNPTCFKIWIATNLLNLLYSFSKKAYPQSGLFLVYLALAIKGVLTW